MNDNELRELRARWKALWVIATIIAVGLLIVAMAATPADASEGCPEWDSGKIDVTGDHTTLRITAPEGFHIVELCVKAGSSNQGLGPEYTTVDPPRRGMTIAHSSGKAISHYSVRYEICTMPSTTTTTVPSSTTTTSTVPDVVTTTTVSTSTTVAPTTTQPPTTTTTIPTTTSTEPSESTTTVITEPPPTTSSTVETSTTSTSAPMATTSTAEAPPQSATPTDELPMTGAEHVALFVVALFALVGGAGLVRLGGQR